MKPRSDEPTPSAPARPRKKQGRPALDPSGSMALHFRIPGNAGEALTRAAGSAPGARSALARSLLLSAMTSAGIGLAPGEQDELTLPLPFTDNPQA